MDIPIPINAAQNDRLRALLTRGNPDFMIVDSKVGGDDLFVLVARGDARKWAMSRLYNEAAPASPAPPVPEPPVKVVAVSDGPSAALPGTSRAN